MIWPGYRSKTEATTLESSFGGRRLRVLTIHRAPAIVAVRPTRRPADVAPNHRPTPPPTSSKGLTPSPRRDRRTEWQDMDRSAPAGQPVADAPARHSDQTHRWWVLAVVGIAQLVIVLDSTIVNIALPRAQHDLGFANSDRQWIVTAYALAFGSLLLLAGRLGDLFGRKWTFSGGLIGFAVASAAGGAAPSFGVLAGARALQRRIAHDEGIP